MKTNSRLKAIVVVIIMLFAIPNQSSATVSDTLTNNVEKIDALEANRMIERLKEIKNMDKSDLSRIEKKALRKEVKAINTSLKGTNNGVYLSVGAIIIIILLLILIL